MRYIRLGLALPILQLSLLVACSQGGRTTDDERDLGLGPIPVPMPMPDLSGPPDLGPQRAELLVPTWVRTIQGSVILWGPWVAAVPRQGESSPAMLVGAFTKGNEVAKLVIGAGEPGAIEVTEVFKPIGVWFDAQSGRIVHSRLLATNQGSIYSSVLLGSGVVANAAGEVTFGGEFHGAGVFFPGTSAATTQSAEKRVDGMSAHRAEDPFVMRYDRSAQPMFFLRGRSPGPLTKTWFNYCQGLAPLSDGNMLMAGVFEDAGFVVGYGTSGATTMSGSTSTYLARINPQGVPSWVARNSGPVNFNRGVRPGIDGATYLLAQFGSGATLLADKAQPVTLTIPGSRRGSAVIKLSSTGTVEWVRRIITDEYSYPGIATSADGRVVISGSWKGKLDLLSDGDRVDSTQNAAETQNYVASWTKDGSLSFFTTLGQEVYLMNVITVDRSGNALIAAQVDSSTSALPLDGGGMIELPKVMTTEMSTFTLLYHVSPAGKRTRVDVLGLNLPVNQLAPDLDGGLGVTGIYGDWVKDIRVGDPAGMKSLPPSSSDGDQMAYFMALRP